MKKIYIAVLSCLLILAATAVLVLINSRQEEKASSAPEQKKPVLPSPPEKTPPDKSVTLKFTSIHYPPFACDPKLEDGKEGFMADILRHIFEKRGYKIEIATMPYSRATKKVKDGKYDGIVIVIKDFMPELIYPQTGTGPNSGTFYVKKGKPWRYKGLESLKGKKIATVQDYMYPDPKVDKYLHSKSPLIEALTGDNPIERNLQKLVCGRVDIYAEGAYSADYAIYKLGWGDKVVPAGYMDGILYNYTAFSPAKPNSKKYAKIFDEGFKDLKESGKLLKILSKYGIKKEFAIKWNRKDVDRSLQR